MSLTPYGDGTPATAPATGGSLLRDTATGESTGSRRIDPVTRDYVIDEYGRILGMNNTRQLVFLALKTVRTSSIVQSLGHRLQEIEVVTEDIERVIRADVEGALVHLTDTGVIELTSIAVAVVRPGTVVTHVTWRDLVTNDVNQTPV